MGSSDRMVAARRVEAMSPVGGRAGTMNSFKCFNCGREYRWSAEIAGRSLRCRCGQKVRCPEAKDETITATESLEDTVADVVLEEHLDQVDTAAVAEEQAPEVDQIRRIPQRGMFGWPIGREVLVWGGLSVVGLSLVILAALVGKYFWQYVVAAVLIGPYAWWRLYRCWPRWTQGRPWLECLGAALGAEDDEQRPA